MSRFEAGEWWRGPNRAGGRHGLLSGRVFKDSAEPVA